MGIIIGAIVIILLLLIIGVSPFLICAGVLAILLLGSVAMLTFFVVTLILLLLSKPVRAKFLRIYVSDVVGTYAIYEIDGTEYKNTFPAEIMFVDKIYKEGKVYSARFRSFKKGGYMLYDWYSYIVIGIGLPASVGLFAGLRYLCGILFEIISF